MKIDIYLGSDIGRWVLEVVSPNDVNHVFTIDDDLEMKARELGFDVQPMASGELESCGRFSSMGVSVHYPKIFSLVTIKKYVALYNLHPGYLPWGRGYFPVFWALWEQTPAGATLHAVSEKVDEGPIVTQRLVECSDSETGFSLFTKVRDAEKAIFMEYWPRIVSGETFPTKEQTAGGTTHRKKDFSELRRRADWKALPPADLIRLARAFTFPGFPGLELLQGDKWLEVRIESSNGVR